MEKISGIIPPNARVTTVDLKNSGTARSGTPSFGREVGLSSVVERNNNLDVATKANFIQVDQMKLRGSKDDPRAEIIQRMSDNFFMKKAKEYEVEKNEAPLADPDKFSNLDHSDVDPVSSDDEAVVGYHLDVMA